jgi:hypothetical protein
VRKRGERDGVGHRGALGWKRRWAGGKRLGRAGKGKKRGRRAVGLGREERGREGLGGFVFLKKIVSNLFQTFETLNSFPNFSRFSKQFKNF